jgi:hypothetical protein
MLAPLDDSFDADDLNRINGDVHRPGFGAKSGLKFDISTSISMAPKRRSPEAGGNGGAIWNHFIGICHILDQRCHLQGEVRAED